MEANLALYRKWRPLTFDDVCGQDPVTTALRTQVQTGRLSHAYLFTGTRGTGKTTCAKILARAACCEHPVEGNPCNQCPSCRAALEGSALDITEIDAASNNGVDNIRSIREEAAFAPTQLSKRVYIIDEVHMLSTGAFNALLKTLEEPPSHVLFILATTELQKMPATILSRCQRYDFRRIGPEVIADRLGRIAAAEGIRLEPAAAQLLARLGDGSMRDAISLLDRTLSGGKSVTSQTVTDALGLCPADRVLALYEKILRSDAAGALGDFGESYAQGQDMVSLFDQLLTLIRDLYILKTTGRWDLLGTAGVDKNAMKQLAEQSGFPELEFFLRSVNDLLGRLNRTAIKRVDSELCLLRLCLRHGGMEAAPAPMAPVQPVIIQAPAPQPQPVPAPVPAEEDGPPPFTDDDLPPWDMEPGTPPAPAPQPAPQPAPVSRPAPAPAPAAPRRTQVEAPKAAPSALKAPFVQAVSPKVNTAVRTYLSYAEVTENNSILEVAVREESLVFIDKPAVREVFDNQARAMGFAGARIVKLGDKKPQEATKKLDALIDRAHKLGVDVEY